jgi:hypothetical protein
MDSLLVVRRRRWWRLADGVEPGWGRRLDAGFLEKRLDRAALVVQVGSCGVREVGRRAW